MSEVPFATFRYAVLLAAGVLALMGFAVMAVQRRAINPFSRTARAIRASTDWLIKPLERRIVRFGANPANAAWWLVWIAIIGGILVITAVQWVANELAIVLMASQSGGSLLYLVVSLAFSLLELAIIVRVIGSWIGAGRHTKWMRPFWYMTEWLIAPLRRIIPPIGMFDFTPLVAWLIVMFVRGWVLGMLARPLVIGGVGAT